jgi:hypothetical protein
MQVSARPDFQFCVCPVFTVPGPGAAFYQLSGLNAGSTYFARVRNRDAANRVYDWSPTYSFRTPPGGARATAPAPVMIEPVLFVKPEHLMASREFGTGVAGYPMSNLFRDSPVAARFGYYDAARGVFLLEFETAGQPIDTIALLNTNLPEVAKIDVLGGNGPVNVSADVIWSLAAQPARASANLPQRMGYHTLIRFPEPRAARFIRLGVTDAFLSGGILHIEHAIMGLNRASKNHAVEKTESPAPMTTIERRRSGAMDRVRGRPMRKVDIELQMLSEAQYETIYGDLWQHENEAVLVVPNSKAGAFLHDRMLYGDLTGGRIVNPTSPRYNRSFTINSII